jgi:hypothetical protein
MFANCEAHISRRFWPDRLALWRWTMFACNYLLSGVEEDTTVVAAADAQNYAQKLGISHDMVVQELGWDDDTDDALRAEVEEAIGSELLDEDTDEVVDVVLLWWRDGDGDLVDGLVDALTDVSDAGYIWLMTPKVGRDGYVDAADLAEAAVTAGLALTNSASVSADWAATRLVRPRGSRR